MKVIVLGGAGDMAGRAVEDLAFTEGIERVTIADRNVAAAETLARKLSGAMAKVDVKRIDADHHAGLVEAMKGYEAAASGLGPFFIYEPKLVKAAIEAGVNYASLCDEWESARFVIENFDGPAREAGVTVITGLGTSPGITNVACRYLAGMFDRVREIHVSVYQPLQAGGGPAVIPHMLHIMSGEISIWRGGRREVVRALSESKEVEFPRYGGIKVWNMGHAEPETVPRFIPGLEEVTFFMGFGPGSSIFVNAAKMGLFAGGAGKVTGRVIAAIERLTAGEPEWGAVRIDAIGERGGVEERETLCGIGQMREATGLCLSVGTAMMVKGKLLTEEGGVYAPEACIDPRPFIDTIRAKGIKAYSDLEMKNIL